MPPPDQCGQTMKLLVVDSDTEFTGMLMAKLSEDGYSVDMATTAVDALAWARGRVYALALVDHSQGGREFLRKYPSVDPLLAAVVLTDRPSVELAVEFLSGGPAAMAVDYILKPAPDLIERIKVLVETHHVRVSAYDWTLERKTRQLFYREQLMKLSPTELQIMSYFIRRPYRCVQYTDLGYAVYGWEMSHKEAVRGLRAHISRLRDKLTETTGRDNVLDIDTGNGLRFVPVTMPRHRIVN
jgi:DNA-binding response OmpR family regulator